MVFKALVLLFFCMMSLSKITWINRVHNSTNEYTATGCKLQGEQWNQKYLRETWKSLPLNILFLKHITLRAVQMVQRFSVLDGLMGNLGWSYSQHPHDSLQSPATQFQRMPFHLLASVDTSYIQCTFISIDKTLIHVKIKGNKSSLKILFQYTVNGI